MDIDATKSWLGFVSTLIWQAMLATCLIYLRKQLKSLIEHITEVKIGEATIGFQSPSETAAKPQADIVPTDDLLGAGGFYTKAGIAKVVLGSGLVEADEKIMDSLLLFQTGEQQTWLVATSKQLFCILDDKDTRTSGRFIQWRELHNNAQPVNARQWKKTVGLIDIGRHGNWLYSTRLHQDTNRLATRVVKMAQG